MLPIASPLMRMAPGEFGTLYTAVYHPAKGTVQLRWPGKEISQDFVNFTEEYKLISLVKTAAAPLQEIHSDEVFTPAENKVGHTYNNQSYDWQQTVTDILINAMSYAKPSADKKELEKLQEKMIKNGEFSWEAISDFWSKKGAA